MVHDVALGLGVGFRVLNAGVSGVGLALNGSGETAASFSQATFCPFGKPEP